MSRPLRIAYPEAWYHVMNRGRRAEEIFADAKDYGMFVDLLRETAAMWNIRVAAYCLMPNHYHLLIQTPEANISRAMRHLNGVYTQRYNRCHRCDGQLFRGRYKSLLIDSDDYLLQAVRYIHRNPLSAGLVDTLNAYPWSSHKAYLSVTRKWEWLFKGRILDILSQDGKNGVGHYRRWVAVPEEDEVSRAVSRKRWPVGLGPPAFIDWLKDAYGRQKWNREVPQSRNLVPDADRIIQGVCAFYGVKRADILKSRRGRMNEPRNVAIYLTRRLRRDPLRTIAQTFQMASYSSVSSVLERMAARLSSERDLREKVNELEKRIEKIQEKT